MPDIIVRKPTISPLAPWAFAIITVSSISSRISCTLCHMISRLLSIVTITLRTHMFGHEMSRCTMSLPSLPETNRNANSILCSFHVKVILPKQRKVTQVTTYVNGDNDKLQAVGLHHTSFFNPSSQPGQDQIDLS